MVQYDINIMILQITYELKDSDKNYSDLFAAIESLGNSSIHILKDSWWVDINDSLKLEDILNILKVHMGENDLIHIIEITDKKTNGWLAHTSWDWLKKRSTIL